MSKLRVLNFIFSIYLVFNSSISNAKTPVMCVSDWPVWEMARVVPSASKFEIIYENYRTCINQFIYGKLDITFLALYDFIRIQQQNQLYNTPGTELFSFLSGITSQALSSPNVSGLPIRPNPNDLFLSKINTTTRYFSQQVNVKPTTIKEISKETYELLQGNSLYITTFIDPTQSVDQANAQMPGLKEWLG